MWEENLKENGLYTYKTESLYCTEEISQYCKSTILQKKLLKMKEKNPDMEQNSLVV